MTARTRSTEGRRAAAVALAMVVALCVCAMLGSRLDPAVALGSLTLKLGTLWPAALYLTAGFGLGWPIARLWPGADDRLAIQFAAGLAALFSLSAILGQLGLLGPPVAIGVVLAGVGLALGQGTRAVLAGARVQEPALAWSLGAPAAALLLVACVMPPGWLWSSEYGGYDALSYHLALPQEWLASGRVEPLAHNVYSYLPSLIESAFTHLGALTLAPEPDGLLAGDGWRLLACQGLHGGLALVASWLTARATRRLALRAGLEGSNADWAGVLAGCVALATPWAVVTGSLAYNEAGVNAMLAGAVLACAAGGLAPAVRGGLVGALVGVACGFKPTSLFFLGAPAGILLLWACGRDRRSLAIAIGAGAGLGLLALAPWLVRNAVHGGNPVFPFAADLLGHAHWSAEQLERYRSGHAPEGGLATRLRMLVWTSPAATPDSATIERFRGFANPQWGVFAPAVVLCTVGLAARARRARPIALALSLGLLAQLACWLAFTHQQSRFLLPTLPLGAALIGLACARVRVAAGERPDARAGAALLGAFLVGVQTTFLVGVYLSDRPGVGNGLGLFPEAFTGRSDPEPGASAAGWSNALRDPAETVYLVGDGTPLYFGPGVLYHTTYDTSPLGALMRESPGEPARWAASLRERGVRWLLVNPSEIERLQRSGWYDPAVTNEAMIDLTESLGGPAAVWEGGRYLVRLPAEGGPP